MKLNLDPKQKGGRDIGWMPSFSSSFFWYSGHILIPIHHPGHQTFKIMMHRYFKMGNVSCRILSLLHFMCEIRVPAMSTACPCRIHPVSGHHRFKMMHVTTFQ